MSSAEEMQLLVEDVEASSEEQDQPTMPTHYGRWKVVFMVVATVTVSAMMGGLAIMKKYPTKKTMDSGLEGIVDLKGDTYIVHGDFNKNSNNKNSNNKAGDSMEGNAVKAGGNAMTMNGNKGIKQLKPCEGSGNDGSGAGAVGVVCCSSPQGTKCSHESSGLAKDKWKSLPTATPEEVKEAGYQPPDSAAGQANAPAGTATNGKKQLKSCEGRGPGKACGNCLPVNDDVCCNGPFGPLCADATTNSRHKATGKEMIQLAASYDIPKPAAKEPDLWNHGTWGATGIACDGTTTCCTPNFPLKHPEPVSELGKKCGPKQDPYSDPVTGKSGVCMSEGNQPFDWQCPYQAADVASQLGCGVIDFDCDLDHKMTNVMTWLERNLEGSFGKCLSECVQYKCHKTSQMPTPKCFKGSMP